jgi:pimeloyl-ACP methyl ester carboxylesterase
MHRCVLLALLLPAACITEDRLSRDYLKPSVTWVAEPKDVGLDAIECEVPIDSEVHLHGWLLTSPAAHGRTIVLLHDTQRNVSQMHPYYTFLQAAGFNVFAFDYRGFGRSTGRPSFCGMTYDMRLVLDWLRARPEVDAGKIGFFGFGFGGALALYTVVHYGRVAALAVESLQSPHDWMVEQAKVSGNESPSMAVGLVEFMWMPEGIEPEENAVQAGAPLLLVTGAQEPLADRKAVLRTWLQAKCGLWMMPDTGTEPNSLLLQDGQYQKSLVAFFTGAFAGAPERVDVTSHRIGTAEHGIAYDLTLSRVGGNDDKWAVQICGIDAQAGTEYRNVWLEGRSRTLRLEFNKDVAQFAAVRVFDAEPAGDTFTRKTPPLAAVLPLWTELQPAIATLRGTPKLDEVKAIAARLVAAEKPQPFPRVFECQLAELFWLLGSNLSASPDASDKAMGLSWLHRAAGAMPEQPKLYVFAGQPASIGFPHQDVVAKSKAMLAQIENH